MVGVQEPQSIRRLDERTGAGDFTWMAALEHLRERPPS